MLIRSGQQRISTGFSPVSNRHAGQKQNRHGSPNRPSVTLRTGHSPQCVGEATAYSEDREHLNQVRQRSRVLKRMRAVGVEKAAAVCSEFFDDLLRSNRALCDGLIRHGIHHGLAVAVDHRLAVRADLLHLHRFDQFRRVIRLQVLNNTLRNQDEGTDKTERQQDPQTMSGPGRPKNFQLSAFAGERCRE